jgi:hypothetical protein
MFRGLCGGLLLVGLALLSLAALNYFGPAGATGVTVDEPQREFLDVAGGETILVSFPIGNSTRHAVRVVGLAEC